MPARQKTSARDLLPPAEWDRREVAIGDFHQQAVEVPRWWSDASTAILARLYLRNRETGLPEMLDRTVGRIREWVEDAGLLDAPGSAELAERLCRLVVFQRAAFNSPVWFNVGRPGIPQVASACYLLDVEDSLPAILDWYKEEGLIFQSGGGAGVNLSNLRASTEPLSRGGRSSGPVSFMRGADASAGTIKSGGATRRAAKMVVLDADHPDIEEFVWCKVVEERKARALRQAGVDPGHSIQYQNANHSVRVTDAFMQAVLEDGPWPLLPRTDAGEVSVVQARELFRKIAEAAWECADPGLQFHDTINSWHTTPSAGPIRTTNPCAEVHLAANEACNLASLNLAAFLRPDGFDIAAFVAAVEDLTTAMDAIALRADYPTEAIAANARARRPLGIGYTNLGSALMAQGLAYDSDAGRAWAASVTALLCAAAWRQSARLAARCGPFAGFEQDRDAVLGVLRRHRGAMDALSGPIAEMAREVMDEALALAERTGVRNSQVTVIAPTGSISFLMGADTTGCEPAFALLATKALVGGGTLVQSVEAVPAGLRALGYGDAEVAACVEHLRQTGALEGAPGLDPAHLPVFATAVGPTALRPEAHVDMVAAIQPFLSGAASKTVNLPSTASVEDIEQVYLRAWRAGVKAISVYRDGSKAVQVLTASAADADPGQPGRAESPSPPPARRRPPQAGRARVARVSIGGAKVYLHVGEYDDGQPAEMFLRVAKAGSSLGGAFDMAAIAASLALQFGVPLERLASHWSGMRFEPAGATNDPDLRLCRSIADWVAGRLRLWYLEPTGQAAPSSNGSAPHAAPSGNGSATRPARGALPVWGECCATCGSPMVRSGTCWSCPACGATSGCG